jgi:hypothetical protein
MAFLNCNRFVFVVFLLSVVSFIGSLLGEPCYRRTGGNVLCTGGTCVGYWNSPDSLGCPGIHAAGDSPHSVHQLVHWPCYNPQGHYMHPKPNFTSGNNPDGFQEQDYFPFPCRWQMACEREVIYLAPYTVGCSGDKETCNYKTIFTAGGDTCSPGE